MSGKFASLFCLFAFALGFTGFVAADAPRAGDREQIVLLRNGEVLAGQVERQKDRYVVANSGTELRVPFREVDGVCSTLDEAYQLLKRRVIAGRIDDHLALADWCLRQNLLGYAAMEIGTAMELDPRNPRVAALDRRLKREQDLSQPNSTPASAPSASTAPNASVSSDELERLVRTLPGNTVEVFTSTVQPMLLNSCATAGCHGPSPSSKFVLVRPAMGQLPTRRLTQRNLYNTLGWIDRANPAESKILLAAKQPHAADQPAAPVLSAMHYQQLAAWVIQATQGVKPQPPATITAQLRTAEPEQASLLSNPGLSALDASGVAPGTVPETANAVTNVLAAHHHLVQTKIAAKASAAARKAMHPKPQSPPTNDASPAGPGPESNAQ